MKSDGYMTLEASLIMPLVIYVCLFIIYLGFFLYDRCVLTQDCYRVALKGSSVYKNSNQEVYNAAYTYVDKVSADKYITKDYRFEIEVNQGITVSTRGNYVMPIHQILSLLGNRDWIIDLKAESKCINPMFTIRLCREFLEKEAKGEK